MLEVALERVAVGGVPRAPRLVDPVRIAALAWRELGPHAGMRAHRARDAERIVVGEVEHVPAFAEALGRGVAETEGLIARGERRAAGAVAPAAAEEIEAPEMEAPR